jgi:hypothetical protein
VEKRINMAMRRMKPIAEIKLMTRARTPAACIPVTAEADWLTSTLLIKYPPTMNIVCLLDYSIIIIYIIYNKHGSLGFCVVVGEGCSATFPYNHAKPREPKTLFDPRNGIDSQNLRGFLPRYFPTCFSPPNV